MEKIVQNESFNINVNDALRFAMVNGRLDGFAAGVMAMVMEAKSLLTEEFLQKYKQGETK